MQVDLYNGGVVVVVLSSSETLIAYSFIAAVCVSCMIELKAENVLQSSSGHYVLCDFGSAAGVTHTKVNVPQLQEEIARSASIHAENDFV